MTKSVFGAAEDWAYVATTNWAFNVGTNEVDRLRVFSAGKVDLLAADAEGAYATNIWFAPFAASLGMVPEANWQMVGNGEPSAIAGRDEEEGPEAAAQKEEFGVDERSELVPRLLTTYCDNSSYAAWACARGNSLFWWLVSVPKRKSV